MSSSPDQIFSGEIAARRSSTSHSRSVRKLVHRQPVPRSFGGRLRAWCSVGRSVPFTALLTLAILSASVGFGQFLVRSEYFALEQTEIVGATPLTRSAILQILSRELMIAEGVSLLAIDSSQTATSLSRLPQLRKAEVRRLWPNQLLVFVEERKPSGILVTNTGSFVFDEDGFLFAEARAEDFNASSSPLITGFDGFGLEIGASVPKRELARMLHYVATMERVSPEMKRGLSEVHFDQFRGLTLVFLQGTRVLCGERSIAETGPILDAMMAEPGGLGQFREINLQAEKHVTVSHRWTANAVRY